MGASRRKESRYFPEFFKDNNDETELATSQIQVYNKLHRIQEQNGGSLFVGRRKEMAEEHVDSPYPPRGPRNRPGTAFQGAATENEIVQRQYIDSNNICRNINSDKYNR